MSYLRRAIVFTNADVNQDGTKRLAYGGPRIGCVSHASKQPLLNRPECSKSRTIENDIFNAGRICRRKLQRTRMPFFVPKQTLMTAVHAASILSASPT